MKIIDNLVNKIKYQFLKFELRNEKGLKEYERAGLEEHNDNLKEEHQRRERQR